MKQLFEYAKEHGLYTFLGGFAAALLLVYMFSPEESLYHKIVYYAGTGLLMLASAALVLWLLGSILSTLFRKNK